MRSDGCFRRRIWIAEPQSIPVEAQVDAQASHAGNAGREKKTASFQFVFAAEAARAEFPATFVDAFASQAAHAGDREANESIDQTVLRQNGRRAYVPLAKRSDADKTFNADHESNAAGTERVGRNSHVVVFAEKERAAQGYSAETSFRLDWRRSPLLAF